MSEGEQCTNVAHDRNPCTKDTLRGEGEKSVSCKGNIGNSAQKFIVARANIFSGANTVSSNKPA
jgi:hypothetical protein